MKTEENRHPLKDIQFQKLMEATNRVLSARTALADAERQYSDVSDLVEAAFLIPKDAIRHYVDPEARQLVIVVPKRKPAKPSVDKLPTP